MGKYYHLEKKIDFRTYDLHILITKKKMFLDCHLCGVYSIAK